MHIRNGVRILVESLFDKEVVMPSVRTWVSSHDCINKVYYGDFFGDNYDPYSLPAKK